MWFVSKRKYNTLEKKYVQSIKELNDIKDHCIMIRKSDMDVLMEDYKTLEIQNDTLSRKLAIATSNLETIRNIVNDVRESIPRLEDKECDTTAVWKTSKGKPLICSKCGYSVWNATDQFMLHCTGCGRRMIDIINTDTEEK